jgi:hypothetical protein
MHKTTFVQRGMDVLEEEGKRLFIFFDSLTNLHRLLVGFIITHSHLLLKSNVVSYLHRTCKLRAHV